MLREHHVAAVRWQMRWGVGVGVEEEEKEVQMQCEAEKQGRIIKSNNNSQTLPQSLRMSSR